MKLEKSQSASPLKKYFNHRDRIAIGLSGLICSAIDLMKWILPLSGGPDIYLEECKETEFEAAFLVQFSIKGLEDV